MLQVKGIIFGDPGRGKTTMLGTAIGDPRLDPVLWLDFEAGRMAIESKVQETSLTALEAEDFQPVPNKANLVAIHALTDLDRVLDVLYSRYVGFKTIVIDNLSEVNYLCLRTVVKECKRLNLKGADGENAGLQEYGRSATQMRSLMREFRDLDAHVWLSAHEKSDKDELTGVIEIRPNLTGKLGAEIPGLFNVVGYVRVDPVDATKREVLWQPTTKIMAKDRSEGGLLGSSMSFGIGDPVMPMIYDRLKIMPEPTASSKSKTKNGD